MTTSSKYVEFRDKNGEATRPAPSTDPEGVDAGPPPPWQADLDGWLRDALDGLFAYATGCVSSGISDPLLHQKVFRYLSSSPDLTEVLTAFLRATYYKPPYTVEDVVKFLSWLERDLGVEVDS